MKYALVFSVLLNAILIWKVGPGNSGPTSFGSTSSFTPDQVETGSSPAGESAPSKSKLLSGADSNEPNAPSDTTANPPSARLAHEVASPDDTVGRWDEKVTTALTNELKLGSSTNDRYRSIRASYQAEVADYVRTKAVQGAEYYVPTLEDQKELIRIKDRYSQQIRQTLGDENYAHYQKMLRDFNANQMMKSSSDGRSPATEVTFIEL